MAEDAGILDFSGIDTTAVETPAEVVETTAVETPAEVSETTETAKVEPAKDKAQQYNSDGTPKEAIAAKAEELPGTEKTPQEIRQALKALRDSDPKHAAAVKQLHGAFERWEAAKAIYPGGVKEMQQAKEFADLVGGAEGYEKLTGTVAAAEASDAKLYDPDKNAELISDVVEDLKAQGKLENLGSLTSAMLDAAKANSEEGYFKAFAPHFLSGLEMVNIPGAFAGLEKALNDPDPARAIAAAKLISGDLSKWYKELDENNKKSKEAVVSPERKKLDADRAAFLKEQTDFKTKESEDFKNNVAKTCESVNNKSLGAELGAFLKMPFFKGFGRENLMPLGNTIKSNLYATLKADNAYQAQMKAMWGAKQPDRAKIEEYHKARVDSIAAEIVRDTVQKMYPGYAKGGAAAGRVAAVAEKKVVAGKVDAAAAAAGRPVYVAAKPSREAIDMDHVDKHGKPDAIMEMIAGRAYLKGTGKWVTWRK